MNYTLRPKAKTIKFLEDNIRGPPLLRFKQSFLRADSLSISHKRKLSISFMSSKIKPMLMKADH